MNIITTEIEKAREIVAHCEERLCAKIERVIAARETEEAFRAAIEAQCQECLEDNDVKNGEVRVSCLESENNVLRAQIIALQDQVKALHDAWMEERRRWAREER